MTRQLYSITNRSWLIIIKVFIHITIPKLGNCLYYLEKYHEAILLYDDTIKLDPQYFMAFLYKGFYLMY